MLSANWLRFCRGGGRRLTHAGESLPRRACVFDSDGWRVEQVGPVGPPLRVRLVSFASLSAVDLETFLTLALRLDPPSLFYPPSGSRSLSLVTSSAAVSLHHTRTGAPPPPRPRDGRRRADGGRPRKRQRRVGGGFAPGVTASEKQRGRRM